MPEPSAVLSDLGAAGPKRLHGRSHRPDRARPLDAGPEVTARDVVALRFVGEQYTARLDVLAVVLGRLSPAVVRDAGRLGSAPSDSA